jgi:hypothetical protein
MKTQMSIWRGFSCETEVAVTWAATPASSGIGALATHAMRANANGAGTTGFQVRAAARGRLKCHLCV